MAVERAVNGGASGGGLVGLVLAAGAGTRMGQPKGLMRTADGEPWLVRATSLLADAGCSRVVAVVGARSEEVRRMLPPGSPVEVVVATQWAEGMSASLKAGLLAATGRAALITPVDMPGLPLAVVRRVIGSGGGITADTIRQAVFGGQPGHPVLVGRSHWGAIVRGLSGDRGARAYLASHGVDEIECGDLYDGHDVDTPRPR